MLFDDHPFLSTLLLCCLGMFRVGEAGAAPASAPDDRLARLLGAGDDRGFEKALAPRALVFPGDHGPHPDFRNEWWYVTGNLDGPGARRFGFELTIFRFALTPEAGSDEGGWRTRQVYIAHFALTDAGAERFYQAEQAARGALGLAGARSDPFRVWLHDWEISALPGNDDSELPRWRLVASDDEFAVDLVLEALKPPVLNGDRGLSQKSAEPGNASYYYSITRWKTEGRVRAGGSEFPVRGLSWLDREWSSSALDPGQVGWDWFALQLSDGSELMYYGLRNADGSESAFSGGTFVDVDGAASPIAAGEVSLQITDRWESPAGGVYPAGWQMSVPRLGLALDVRPVMADQELFTLVRYWEGAVDVSGRKQGLALSGRGYVELTGYAAPLRP